MREEYEDEEYEEYEKEMDSGDEEDDHRHPGKSRQYKKHKDKLPEHIVHLIVTTTVLLVLYIFLAQNNFLELLIFLLLP